MEMKERINGLFFNSGVADCETLNRLLSESFDAKPEDVENLKSISTLLRRYECVDLPLYAKVAEKLYSLDPTADAAYSLAMMFLKRQEFDKTETYLKEAIDKAEDSDPSKADYYMWMAKVKQAKKQYVAAKDQFAGSVETESEIRTGLYHAGENLCFLCASIRRGCF